MSLFRFKDIGFKRSDAVAALLIIVLSIYLSHLVRWSSSQHSIQFSVMEEKQIEKAKVKLDSVAKQKKRSITPVFDFDPNTISIDSLKLLGLPTFLVERWIKLRTKGFVFYNPPDLLKVYGVDTQWYERVRSYVKIRPKVRKSYKRTTYRKGLQPRSLHINEADTSDWKMIPGIGSAYARRICKYRDLLGGFVSHHQLIEVYGINEELYDQVLLYLDTSIRLRPTFLSVDSIAKVDWAGHPYLSYRQARGLKNYISSDNIATLRKEDINHMVFLDSLTKAKIRPYLSD